MNYLLAIGMFIWLVLVFIDSIKMTYRDFLNFFYIRKSKITTAKVIEFIGNAGCDYKTFSFPDYYAYKVSVNINGKEYLGEVLNLEESLCEENDYIQVNYVIRKNGKIFFPHEEYSKRFIKNMIFLTSLIVFVSGVCGFFYFSNL